MSDWEIHETQTLTFDGERVRALRLQVVAGDVSVTATDGPARLEVHSLEGPPLSVSLRDGVLVVGYPDLTWNGLLDWLRTPRPRPHREVSLAVAVPADCEVRLGTVSADAVVSGVARPTSVRTVSGEITLDSLGAAVTARTVSGDVEALELAGELTFETVSGNLTVGGGQCTALAAKTVSGDVAVSLAVGGGASVRVVTVSGDVALRLAPESGGTDVRVDSVSGRVTSAFDGVAGTNEIGRQRLRGVVGDGSGSLKVRTVSGDVDLLRG